MSHLVITGGSGGLGRAIATAFAGHGWHVAAPGRDQLDVTDSAAIRDFFASRPVDLLVCAAGTTGENPLARLAPSVWEQVFSVNFHGSAACARAVIPGMLERGAGHLVFVSSHAAIHPPAGLAAYATAKAALLGLARDLARRHGGCGIRANVILPGFMDTRMTAEVTPARRAAVLASHALGRLNTPAATAEFIHFLHHGLPHTSGQVFQLDSRD